MGLKGLLTKGAVGKAIIQKIKQRWTKLAKSPIQRCFFNNIETVIQD